MRGMGIFPSYRKSWHSSSFATAKKSDAGESGSWRFGLKELSLKGVADFITTGAGSFPIRSYLFKDLFITFSPAKNIIVLSGAGIRYV